MDLVHHQSFAIHGITLAENFLTAAVRGHCQEIFRASEMDVEFQILGLLHMKMGLIMCCRGPYYHTSRFGDVRAFSILGLFTPLYYRLGIDYYIWYLVALF